MVVLSLCCAAAAQPQCSIRDAVGVWAFTAIGWEVQPGESTAAPVTGIGMAVIDYSGKVTGPGTITTGALVAGTIPAGVPLDFDMVNSTVQVNADCTALLKMFIQIKGMPGPPIGLYVDRWIVLPNQDEILAMGVASPLSRPMWIYTMKRISHVPSAVSWPAVPAQ